MRFLRISKIFPRFFWIIFLFFFLFHCSLRLKAPPITFTQTQTASEKQMVGEGREIEKDGWLISSIQSSSSGSELWKKIVITESENREFVFLQKKLAYLEPELRPYRFKGILGESFEGKLKFHPENSKTLKDPEEIRKLRETVELVNTARERIIEIRVRENPDLSRKSLLDQEVQLRIRYLEYGEYFEAEPGKWIKKE